jgi:hypothetical protein
MTPNYVIAVSAGLRLTPDPSLPARGVYPELYEILRFAQNDQRRRAQASTQDMPYSFPINGEEIRIPKFQGHSTNWAYYKSGILSSEYHHL